MIEFTDIIDSTREKEIFTRPTFEKIRGILHSRSVANYEAWSHEAANRETPHSTDILAYSVSAVRFAALCCRCVLLVGEGYFLGLRCILEQYTCAMLPEPVLFLPKYRA